VIVSLPGLHAPEGLADPAERRRWLRELPRDELVGQLLQLALGLRALGFDPVRELARASRLPLPEVAASPFGLRAVAMAAADGACVIDRELRVPISWAERYGDVAVASEGHGYWDAGVLQIGKYESFCQDDPLSLYNPNHMSKWGPHELLHRACLFFWRDDMTRWELYLGARLNEIVPVVLWYGLDEVMRLDREGAFDRELETERREAHLPEALWLTESEQALRARAERTASNLLVGLAHFERELAAVDTEIETSRVCRIEHDVLD